MSTRNITLLILLAAIALLSWLVARERQAEPQLNGTATPIRSGYYILDANIFGTDENGDPQYTISATQATQETLGEPIELTEVTIIYGQDERSAWRIRANSATLSGEAQSLQMQGDVVATLSSSAEPNTVQMRTRRLDFDTLARTVETNDTVRFEMSLGQLMATGMRASLDDNTIELRSNIRGQFVP